ncbi:MAG: hypothetical protein K8W52_28775 [Deltaproteobacteria bacterium]|nr:hypothetical protein [Deltaproteobacteria bacterium]
MDEPPARAFIDAMIADSLAAFDDDVRAAWARIRIEPALWRCADPEAPRERYWAIAIEDDQVLWYNDIEHGINRSALAEHGIISEHGCDQTELVEILEWIASAQSDARWPTLDTSTLPVELAGPGTILRRQPSYWELRSATGVRCRVHFLERCDDRFAATDYLGIALVSDHPLLALRAAPSGRVFFNGQPRDPAAVVAALDATVREISHGWRTLADYADLGRDLEASLRVGFGLLVSGPAPVCSAVAAELEGAGVSTSSLGSAGTVERPPCRALVLGRSYVVAHDFRFERRPD